MGIELQPFDFIEEVKRLDDADRVVENLHREASRVGIEFMTLCGLPPPSQPSGPQLLANISPVNWMAYYETRDFFSHDPVVQWASQTTEPFRWADIPAHVPRTRNGDSVLDEAAEFGLVDGFVVPMFSPRDWQAAVFFALPRRLDAAPADLASLHLMAIYATNQVRRLTGQVGGSAPVLTEREAECLTWIAAGKTVDDVATILSLSRLTVQTHLRNVRMKLNATTIAQAVAEGIRSGAVRI